MFSLHLLRVKKHPGLTFHLKPQCNRLYPKVSVEDLFARKAHFHKSCHHSFKLRHVNHLCDDQAKRNRDNSQDKKYETAVSVVLEKLLLILHKRFTIQNQTRRKQTWIVLYLKHAVVLGHTSAVGKTLDTDVCHPLVVREQHRSYHLS